MGVKPAQQTGYEYSEQGVDIMVARMGKGSTIAEAGAKKLAVVESRLGGDLFVGGQCARLCRHSLFA